MAYAKGTKTSIETTEGQIKKMLQKAGAEGTAFMEERTRAGDLLPCPFCGSRSAILYTSNAAGMSWVACVSCGLDAPTETGVSAEDAVSYWNHRDPALTAMARALLDLHEVSQWRYDLENVPRDRDFLIEFDSEEVTIGHYVDNSKSPVPWAGIAPCRSMRPMRVGDKIVAWREIPGPDTNAAPLPPAPLHEASQPTHRHKKRGTEYVLLGYGKMQAGNWGTKWRLDTSDGGYGFVTAEPVDMREVAIYRSIDDGSLWVRPREEFEDGRLEPLPPAPQPKEA